MSDNHYDILESIFTIPDDVDAGQKQDLIAHTLRRIKGTLMTVCAASAGEVGLIPDSSIYDCCWNIHGQLEQLEELIKFEVKE